MRRAPLPQLVQIVHTHPPLEAALARWLEPALTAARRLAVDRERLGADVVNARTRLADVFRQLRAGADEVLVLKRLEADTVLRKCVARIGRAHADLRGKRRPPPMRARWGVAIAAAFGDPAVRAAAGLRGAVAVRRPLMRARTVVPVYAAQFALASITGVSAAFIRDTAQAAEARGEPGKTSARGPSGSVGVAPSARRRRRGRTDLNTKRPDEPLVPDDDEFLRELEQELDG
jgi:hypothetical protein